jgi:beta-glucanase (GH16 family)
MIRSAVLMVLTSFSLVSGAAKVRSAEVDSKDQLLYGRFEVRMRTAPGSGIVSAFFTFEQDGWEPGTNKPWRELDIEVLGRYTDRYQTNIITGTAENRVTSEFFANVTSNPATAYHTYTIEWTPDYVSWNYDGAQVRKTEFGDAKKQVADCRDIPQSFRFNFWAAAIPSWLGAFSDTILPRCQYINWIKYYKYSKDTKAFTLDWTDNFDTFDANRWGKATHLMEDFTQFTSANAFVKNGTLVLAMTDMNSTGLSNITVPTDNTTSVSPLKQSLQTQTPMSVSNRNGQIVCRINGSSFSGARFELVNLNGSTLQSQSVASNMNEVTFDGNGLSNGTYLIRAVKAGSTTTATITFVK